MTMTTPSGKWRLLSVGVIALAGAIALVAVVGAVLYRSMVSNARARTTPRSVVPTEATIVSREQPQVLQPSAPETVPATTKDVSAATSLQGPETASKETPFIEARQEQRDSVWALQTESGVRDALATLRDKKIRLESVQCASIRCTLAGTIGQGGQLRDVVRALHGAGLERGRFKQSRSGDGTLTFSAVFARQGYQLDGSPKEAVAKTL
jgi:hypothetical protein